MSRVPELPLFGGASDPPGAFFPTNRLNALHVLAAGFVPSRAGFPKRHPDLLDHSPDRVPVFRSGITRGLAESLADTSFPVLVEVAPPPAGSPEFRPRGMTNGPGVSAWAPTGPIRLSGRRALHFRTEQELREHAARRYDNVDPSAVELKVSPDLFAVAESDAGDEGEFIGWLKSLPAAPAAATEDGYRRADRRSGALCVLAAVAGGREPAGFVQAILGPGPTPHGLPGWLLGEQAEGIDARIFTAAREALVRTSPEAGFRPSEVLDAVERALAPGREDAELLRLMERARAIIRNDAEYSPSGAKPGTSAIKALVLTLLRRKPESLLPTLDEDAPGDPDTRYAAAYLVGASVGRVRLSTAFRPPQVDALLVEAELGELAPRMEPAAPPEPAPSRAPRTDAEGLVEDLLATLDERREDDPRVVTVCEALGWSDLLRDVIEATAATVESDPGDGRLRLVVTGLTSHRREVDAPGFRARLLAEDRDRVEDVLASLPRPPVPEPSVAGPSKTVRGTVDCAGYPVPARLKREKAWFDENVPRMSDAQIKALCRELRRRGWPRSEVTRLVHAARPGGADVDNVSETGGA